MKNNRGYYDLFVNTCGKNPTNVGVWQHENNGFISYTYSELFGVCEYISQNLQQLKWSGGIIGLRSGMNFLIPCVIAAIHKCSTTFIFLDLSIDIETALADCVSLNYIISIGNDRRKPSMIFNKTPEKSITLYGLVVDFYCFDGNSFNHRRRRLEPSFIMKTSGSTGEAKHVEVPVQCIQPNIDDLTSMFQITSEDVIYFSTPLTFDPTMIEILLAVMNSASLLIAPPQPEIIFPKHHALSVTVWQTTPSKFFYQTNEDIKNRILSAYSKLRILALGGEPLYCVKRINELKHPRNQTRIFALYGVTEMSCWATVTELNCSKMITEVPLGACLSETQLFIKPTSNENQNFGKILLMSKSRRCVILNKSGTEDRSLKFVDTGDLGEQKRGNIYYRGRTDDIIKRFGVKVNLQTIEAITMECPKVKSCSCIWLEKPKLLVVYFSSGSLSSQELSDYLKCRLDEKHFPDKVIRVSNLPMSTHGKISKSMIANMFKTTAPKQSFENIKLYFIKELKRILGKNFSFDNIKNKSFMDLGGTSFLAISMCNRLSSVYPEFGKLILPQLVNDANSISDVLLTAEKEITGEKAIPRKRIKITSSTCLHTLSDYSKPNPSIIRFECFITIWKENTGKCVDASPTYYSHGCNSYVTVGSHSGKVIVVDAMSGYLRGCINLDSRVEATVYCSHKIPLISPFGVVGAQDGTVCCFLLDNGHELWRTNVGSKVKSKITSCNGLFYVATYAGNVKCLYMMTGEILNTIEVADQAISANLVLAKNQFILLGTLSGVCACIYTQTNSVAWRGTLDGPIFASPTLYDQDKYVIFAEVNGDIHCRTVEKGIKIWRFQGASGNIFSSLLIRALGKLTWQMVFGCYDNNVYSVLIKNYQPSLHWKSQMSAPMFCTPSNLLTNLILSISTNGKMSVLDAYNGTVIVEHQMAGEIFSSPVVVNDYIYLGSRDDHLYCLKYEPSM